MLNDVVLERNWLNSTLCVELSAVTCDRQANKPPLPSQPAQASSRTFALAIQHRS